LGLVKFVVKITTSFLKLFSFYHNYLIFIFKIYNHSPNIFWFDNCKEFLQNKMFDLFPSYLGPYLLVWHPHLPNFLIFCFLGFPPFVIVHCHVICPQIHFVQSLDYFIKWPFLYRILQPWACRILCRIL